jgi:hypothetical protein
VDYRYPAPPTPNLLGGVLNIQPVFNPPSIELDIAYQVLAGEAFEF